jgi:hypothetical protein
MILLDLDLLGSEDGASVTYRLRGVVSGAAVRPSSLHDMASTSPRPFFSMSTVAGMTPIASNPSKHEESATR